MDEDDRKGPAPAAEDRGAPVGRRVLLGMLGLGAAGIAFGSSRVGRSLGALVPGDEGFRFYTITGSYPAMKASAYRLAVGGMVDRKLTLTLADLQRMPSTTLVHTFQCVTGWTVPDVHWEGVRLAQVLEAAGVRDGATALRLFSFDGAYTESLTLAQARRSDVLVAYRMLGGPISAAHGGPVRLYVAPMYGYKSIKWLSAIQVTDEVVPGFWEDNGYPVDAWIGGTPQ